MRASSLCDPLLDILIFGFPKNVDPKQGKSSKRSLFSHVRSSSNCYVLKSECFAWQSPSTVIEVGLCQVELNNKGSQKYYSWTNREGSKTKASATATTSLLSTRATSDKLETNPMTDA
jgi:hypothetical protein